MDVKNINVKSLLFKNTGIKQTIFKNTFWLAVGEGVSRLFTFLLTIYALRVFGPTEFGKFTFALAVASLFIVFSDFGLSDITTRDFARDKTEEKEFPAIFSLKILLSIGTLLIIIVSSFFIVSDPLIRAVTWLLGVYLLFSNFNTILYAFFRARLSMEYESWIKILHTVTIVTIGFYVIFNFPSIKNLSYAYLLAVLINLIFTLIFFSFRIQPLKLNWDKSVWKKFLIRSWPLGLALALGTIYLRIDSIMLGFWGQISEVGLYNAAYRVVGMTIIPSTLMFASFFPVLSNTFKKSKEKAQRTYNLYQEITIIIAIPLVIGGIMLASKIILFLCGENYIPSILVFQILLVVTGVNFIYNPYGMMFVVLGKQKVILFINSIGAVINIILNIILIPRYSLYGAAIATLITYLILLFITFKLSRHFIPFNFFYWNLLKTFGIVIISSTIMIGVISMPFISSLHILFMIALGIMTYFLILFFLMRISSSMFNPKH